MLTFTVTQWAIIALVFVAGWLLGLASHPGGRKWRERYAAEREAHAAARKDADARVAAAEAKHRELERDHARLVTTAPVMTRGEEPTIIAPRRTTNRYADVTTVPGEKRGWFDWGTPRA